MEAGESPIRVAHPRPPGSILKGMAPRALLASPDASPRASDEHADWNTLAEVRLSLALLAQVKSPHAGLPSLGLQAPMQTPAVHSEGHRARRPAGP